MTRRTPLALLALAALGLAGCGGAEADTAAEEHAAPLEQQDPGPVHVHGLGHDRTSGVLFIATHTGMWELPASASKATRIGDSHQDTMGFALMPSGRFLGSGHPDAREDRPPHLGLIESTDRGRSWRTISLSGEADFHVLRARGKVVYGFDGANGRFLASADGGRTWQERAAPETLFDLAIDPADSRRLVATGERTLYLSGDGGRRWRPLAGGVPGYLAWPAPRRLYVAAPDGAFLAAMSPAGPWQSRTALEGPPSALHASSGTDLFVALHDGTILRTRDGGTSWELRATP